MGAPQWKQLVDHVMSIPERVYETWVSGEGWDNRTQFGKEYGEDGVSWCAIFDWDMYNDVGLSAIVPKFDNVSAIAARAKAKGQWSEYPSVGAEVDFGDGAHTEIVVGFDAANVYTKGGNSIQSGAVDNGQGNGVWSHSHARTSSYVTGYFAPRFPDGQCPPTADPHDYRGGKAVTSWRWSPTSSPAVTVSLANVIDSAHRDGPAPQGSAAHRADVLPVEQALQSEGLLPAQRVDGSFGTDTVTAYAAWQRRLGFSGADANGIPGQTSLTKLGSKHGFTVR